MERRSAAFGVRLNLVLALAFFLTAAWPQSKRIITAGSPVSEYPTLGEAVNALPIPAVEDVEIHAELPPEGFSDPIDIEGGALGLGEHYLEIVGSANPFSGEGEITYYVGGHVEYRVSEDDQVEVVHKFGAPARQVQSADGNAGAKEFFLTDHLGSTVAMIDEAGLNTSAVYEYFPHGHQIQMVSGSDAPVTETFTGKELDVYDEDAVVDGQGLYYFGGRYFDPYLGIWITPDPSSQYNSAYAYSTHPIDGVDSDGEFWNIVGQMALNGATEIAMQWAEAKLNKQEFKIDWKSVASEAVQGGNPVTGALKVAKKAKRAAKILKEVQKAQEASKVTKVSAEGMDAAQKVAAKGNVGSIPKTRTGPGKVAPEDRDPKRFFDDKARAAKRAQQDHKCPGCGTKIDETNSRGHHIERHADGGKTVPENHAEICITCHDEVHSGR